ncbi:MAG: hypothetical protein CL608_08510 [Anaerolineaceae bacterium]|nr:hypothetical protein [Anaerolineaceae bacterium]
MVEQVKILDWIIEVDRARTIAFYTKMLTPSASCGCLYCRNFEEAVPGLPKKFGGILAKLGVDIKKAAEVYELGELKTGIHLYGGWYHVTGRIVQGDESFLHIDDRTRQANFRQLDEDFYIGFTTKINLVAKDFPKPVLQLEFTGNLPWLLTESP